MHRGSPRPTHSAELDATLFSISDSYIVRQLHLRIYLIIMIFATERQALLFRSNVYDVLRTQMDWQINTLI